MNQIVTTNVRLKQVPVLDSFPRSHMIKNFPFQTFVRVVSVCVI